MEYPADLLPHPLLQGYLSAPDNNVLVTEMESGATRLRRLYSDRQQTLGVAWIFSSDQLAIFEAWFKYKIDQGAAWFDMSVKDGQGLSELTCRFQSSYQVQSISHNQWRVQAAVRVRNPRTMSESDLNLQLNAGDFLPNDWKRGDWSQHVPAP